MSAAPIATRLVLALLVLAGCGKGGPATRSSEETPATAAKAGVTATKSAPYENSLGMKFVPLAGTEVLMGIWETRMADYQKFIQGTGGQWPAAVRAGANYPVHNVSWNDAIAFCRWLTEQERKLGRIGPTDQFRLPTDKEWDAAVGKDRYPWGPKWPKMADWQQLPGYKPSGGENIAPVGSHAANARGIHDLGGNLYEWCMDWYTRNLNTSEIRLEYERMNEDRGGKHYKVLRGTSWVFFDPINTISAYRFVNLPQNRGGFYGFRCVLEFGATESLPDTGGGKAWNEPPAFDEDMKRGREIYVGRCSECHHLFDPSSYPNDEWETLMGKMRGKAKLKEREYQDLTHFLKSVRTEN